VIITASATIAIADGPILVEEATVITIPAPVSGTGTGRLVHPETGIYDYPRPPDAWKNMRGDAIIPPVWSSVKTLSGAANTLFTGTLRDVICDEQWTQGLVWKTDFADRLISMWMNPPDPAVAYVEWWPNYTTDQGFKVVLLSLTLGGSEITTHSISHGGYDRGPMNLKMRLIERL
jgi:hypothetical protein